MPLDLSVCVFGARTTPKSFPAELDCLRILVSRFGTKEWSEVSPDSRLGEEVISYVNTGKIFSLRSG